MTHNMPIYNGKTHGNIRPGRSFLLFFCFFFPSSSSFLRRYIRFFVSCDYFRLFQMYYCFCIHSDYLLGWGYDIEYEYELLPWGVCYLYFLRRKISARSGKFNWKMPINVGGTEGSQLYCFFFFGIFPFGDTHRQIQLSKKKIKKSRRVETSVLEGANSVENRIEPHVRRIK